MMGPDPGEIEVKMQQYYIVQRYYIVTEGSPYMSGD
jgi:hypothetical protein